MVERYCGGRGRGSAGERPARGAVCGDVDALRAPHVPRRRQSSERRDQHAAANSKQPELGAGAHLRCHLFSSEGCTVIANML